MNRRHERNVFFFRSATRRAKVSPATAAWREGLDRAVESLRAERVERPDLRVGNIRAGWWLELFPNPPTESERRGHACGADQMLIIVAYDIADHRRLARLARHCEDYGVRVQYSVFECRMDADRFECFWQELKDLMDPDADRLVAYRICARCAAEIAVAGTMERNETVTAYVF